MAFETFNLANIYQAVDQSNANRLRNQMMGQQLQQNQYEQQKQIKLADLARGAFNPDGSFNQQKFAEGLPAVDPLQAMTYRQQMSQQEQSAADAEQKRRFAIQDQLFKNREETKNLMAGINDQASLDAALTELEGAGIITAALPRVYDPKTFGSSLYNSSERTKANTPNFQQINLGGKVMMVDMNPNTNPDIMKLSLDKTMTPGEIESQRHNRATENIQNANLRIAQAREAREGAGGGQKAPPGFRYTADGQSLEPIPGSDAAIKRDQSEQKVSRAQEQLVGNAKNVIRAADSAIKILNNNEFNTTGIFGSVASMVPGSDRKALEGALETIKANLGFDSLQTMRDNSPTGGALGSVAVQELIALQSTVANLDPSQPVEVLRDNINQVMQRYRGIIRQTESAQAPQSPKVGAIENGYVYTGGDPASPNSWKKAR